MSLSRTMLGYFGFSSTPQPEASEDSMTQRPAESSPSKPTSMARKVLLESSSQDRTRATRYASAVPDTRSKIVHEVNPTFKARLAEINDLPSRNNDLIVAICDKESEVKNLQKQLHSLHEEVDVALQEKDDQLLSLRGRHNELLNSHQSQEANIKTLISLISAVQDKLRDTKACLTKTQLELSSCRDDLFRVQPLAQVPDVEILQDFESLCQQITNWVDEEISLYEESHPGAGPGQIFSAGGDEDTSLLLRAFPEAGEHVVRYQIHRHLCQTMFGKDVYLLGLPTEVKHALQAAEKGMKSLEPPRDPATINVWRSETLRALAASSEIEKERDKHIQKLTKHLFEHLKSTFPAISGQQKSIRKLYNQVMVPASGLACKIQGSLSRYEFGMADEPFIPYNELEPGHLELFKLVDVRTRKTLKPGSAVVQTESGYIGRVIIPLEPGLYRNDGGGKEITLKSNAYLVDLFYPVGKRVHGGHDSR